MVIWTPIIRHLNLKKNMARILVIDIPKLTSLTPYPGYEVWYIGIRRIPGYFWSLSIFWSTYEALEKRINIVAFNRLENKRMW